MTLLADLLKSRTEEEALAFVLQKLKDNGAPTTSWQTGSWGDVTAHYEAAYTAELDATIALVAQGGFLRRAALITPEGGPGWLDELAEGFFKRERAQATATRGKLRLTYAPGVGPVTKAAGTVTVSDGTRKLAFTNAAALTIPLGGSVDADIVAAKPGAAYNLANGGITVLQTSLPGVTISNPAIAGTSSWITAQGTDVQSNALLVDACENQWGTIGSGANDSSYLSYVTSASLEVTRTRLIQDPDTGIVQVVIAGPSGPVSTDAFNAVAAKLLVKRPLCVRALAVNATASNTGIAGSVIVNGGYDLAATLAAAQSSVLAFGRTQAIGQLLILEKLKAAIVDTIGVDDVVLTAPLINTSLGATTVFTPNFLLTATR